MTYVALARPARARPMSFAPGQSLDRYTIEALLGEGGMGTVYRAFDRRLQRHVALKVLRFSQDEDAASAVAGALREARAAAAITHPSVTAVFDAGEIEGTAFIAQELVRGATLRALLGAGLPPLPTRVRWLMEIAAGLAAGHRAGVVHRDVKPENVIIRDDARAKVLDFGIARRTRAASSHDTHGSLDSGTPSFVGAPRGTPAYMSPEQIRDERVDGRSDQFSWGVLAHELLTGRLPWKRAKDFLGYLGAVLTEEVDAPSRLAPEIPAALDTVVLRALCKQPEQRFASMSEIAALLAQLLDGAAPDTAMSGAATPAAASPSLPSTPTLVVRRAPPPAPLPRAAAPSSPPPPATPPTAPSPVSLTLPTAPSPVSPSLPTAPSPVSPAPTPRSIGPAPTPRSALVEAPASRRSTPARLRPPRFDAAVDLDAELAQVPAGATCKGLLFLDLLGSGARAGLTHAELARAAGIAERRYQRFHDYPLADLLRLLVATARHAHPGVPVGEGLRRIGHGAFDVVMGSAVGRALLSVLGRQLDPLLKRGPRVYRQMISRGEMVTEPIDHRTYLFHLRELPLFLETYQVGALEGVLAHCGAEGQILVQLDAPGTGRIQLTLR